jgi:amicoumacin kinase
MGMMESNKIQLSGGYQNQVFYLEQVGKIERISLNKTKEMILEELDWMDFLYKRGVALPKPAIDVELSGEQVKTYFEYIEGEPVSVTNDSHWNTSNFEEFGRILGRMHSLSKVYHLEVKHRPTWTEENPDVFKLRVQVNRELQTIYDSLLQELCTYEKNADTFGLIHNDFHQGNLIMAKDGTITVIDFDDCALNWFAQDIAVFFYHAYWQQESFIGNRESFCREFLNHFFTGYQEENLLKEETIKQIPIFLKLREIFLYQLFRVNWDKNNLEDWQRDTLLNLENNIKHRVPYAGITDFSIYVTAPPL